MPSRVPSYNPHPSIRPESRKRYDRTRRDTGAKAFYHTAPLAAIRRIKLAMVPYCERCMQDDQLTAATDVHHVQELADHPESVALTSTICKVSVRRAIESGMPAQGQ